MVKNIRRPGAGREASERLARLKVATRSQQLSSAGTEKTIRRNQTLPDKAGGSERAGGSSRLSRAVRSTATEVLTSTRPEQEHTDTASKVEAAAAAGARRTAARAVGKVPGAGTVVSTVSSRSGVSENTEAVGQRFAKDAARRGGLRTVRVAGKLGRRSAMAAGRGAKVAAQGTGSAARTAAVRAGHVTARAAVHGAQTAVAMVRGVVAVVSGITAGGPFTAGIGAVLAIVAVMASIFGAVLPTVSNTVSCTTPAAGAVGVAFAGYGPEQMANAKEIIRAGQDAKLDTRDITIGVMVAMGESSLRILAYGDAVGPDSRGLFQQRDSWGPLAVRMNAYGSAGLFFEALKKVPNREAKEPTQIAHAAQRNADPNHYTKFWEAAVSVVSRARGGTGSTCDVGTAGVPGELGKGDDYPFNHGQYNASNPVTGLAFKNCTDFAWWRLMQQLGITDQAQMHSGRIGPGNGATWGDAWKRAGWTVTMTPTVGAIIWYGPGNPGGNPIYGHVAVVKAITVDGKVIEEGYNMAPDKLGAYYTREIPADKPTGYLLVPTKEQYAKAA